MTSKDYVESLFRDYEETPELRDFVEELESNMNDRIASLVKKGIPETDAFARVKSELGDITVLADQLSLKRRQEVFKDAYLGIRHYMKPGRVTAYVLFSAALLCGLIISAVTYLSTGIGPSIENSLFDLSGYIQNVSMFGVLLAFLVVTVPGLSFLGLTQETSARYPMSTKRAAWYTLAVFLITFGITLFPLVYFAANHEPAGGLTDISLVASLSSLMPFAIPGFGLLAFLCLTEKDHLKPWAHNQYKAEWQKNMELWNDSAVSTKFGLFAGAIWIFAFALFFVLGFTIGFRFSWLAFLFAVAIQLVVQGFMYKSTNNTN